MIFMIQKTDYKIASEGSNIFVILRKGSGEAFVFIKDLQCGLYVIYPIDFGRRETDVQIEQEKISDGQPAFIVSTWCGNKAFAFLPRQEGDYAQMDLIRRDEMASGRYSIATPENPELYAFAVWKENGTYGYVFLRNNDKENTEKEVDYFKHEVAKPVDSSLYIETSVTDDPAQGFTCYHGKYRYEAVPILYFLPNWYGSIHVTLIQPTVEIDVWHSNLLIYPCIWKMMLSLILRVMAPKSPIWVIRTPFNRYNLSFQV